MSEEWEVAASFLEAFLDDFRENGDHEKIRATLPVLMVVHEQLGLDERARELRNEWLEVRDTATREDCRRFLNAVRYAGTDGMNEAKQEELTDLLPNHMEPKTAMQLTKDPRSRFVQRLFAEHGDRQLNALGDSRDLSLNLFGTAVVLAMGNSAEPHEQFCKGFARVHGESDDQIVRNRIRLAAMLRPAPETTSIWQLLPSKRGEQSVPAWAERWFDLTEALGCYRLGDGSRAITCLKRTSRPMPDKYSANGTLPVLFTLLEAMANQQLGNDGDARILFAKARDQMPEMRDENPFGTTAQWQDRLLCEIIFEEAEALIDPHE